MKKHSRVAYSSDIQNVALARQRIARFAEHCGFSTEEIADIRLAAGEALSNAIEHGNETPARRIVVDCRFENNELRIEIQDSGSDFPEPLHRATVEPDHRGRGFGIFLMRRLMHDVKFDRNGSVVRLIRRRP